MSGLLLVFALLGCGSDGPAVPEAAAAAPEVASSAETLLAQSPPSTRRPRPGPPRDSGPRGDAPVYVLLFTHHYGGKGGYYATPAQVRDVVDALEDTALLPHVTLFFDGIGVERLGKADPKLLGELRAKKVVVGFHGEDVHGPWPVVDPLEEGPKDGGLVSAGMEFPAAVEAIRARYAHALGDVSIGDDGYIRRDVRGKADPKRAGGIAAVRDAFGDVRIASGTALTQPAALFALRQLAPELDVWQGAGPFAFHFLRRTKDPDLIDELSSYLGKDTSVFWFMGTLATRQGPTNDLPAWSDDGVRTKRALEDLPRREPTVVSLNLDVGDAALRDLLTWTKAWVADHPGSAFVSPGELVDLVAPQGRPLQPAAVAAQVAATWSAGPPDVLSVSGAPVSLAEAFEVLASALDTGSLEAVTPRGLNGPVDRASALVQATGEVKRDDVVSAAREALTVARRSPYRAIPASVAVGGKKVGFHQLYRLMADAVGAKAGAKLQVPTGEAFPPAARTIVRTWPHSGAPDTDFWVGCQLWTARPVTWR